MASGSHSPYLPQRNNYGPAGNSNGNGNGGGFGGYANGHRRFSDTPGGGGGGERRPPGGAAYGGYGGQDTSNAGTPNSLADDVKRLSNLVETLAQQQGEFKLAQQQAKEREVALKRQVDDFEQRELAHEAMVIREYERANLAEKDRDEATRLRDIEITKCTALTQDLLNLRRDGITVVDARKLIQQTVVNDLTRLEAIVGRMLGPVSIEVGRIRQNIITVETGLREEIQKAKTTGQSYAAGQINTAITNLERNRTDVINQRCGEYFQEALRTGQLGQDIVQVANNGIVNEMENVRGAMTNYIHDELTRIEATARRLQEEAMQQYQQPPTDPRFNNRPPPPLGHPQQQFPQQSTSQFQGPPPAHPSLQRTTSTPQGLPPGSPSGSSNSSSRPLTGKERHGREIVVTSFPEALSEILRLRKRMQDMEKFVEAYKSKKGDEKEDSSSRKRPRIEEESAVAMGAVSINEEWRAEMGKQLGETEERVKANAVESEKKIEQRLAELVERVDKTGTAAKRMLEQSMKKLRTDLDDTEERMSADTEALTERYDGIIKSHEILKQVCGILDDSDTVTIDERIAEALSPHIQRQAQYRAQLLSEAKQLRSLDEAVQRIGTEFEEVGADCAQRFKDVMEVNESLINAVPSERRTTPEEKFAIIEHLIRPMLAGVVEGPIMEEKLEEVVATMLEGQREKYRDEMKGNDKLIKSLFDEQRRVDRETEKCWQSMQELERKIALQFPEEDIDELDEV